MKKTMILFTLSLFALGCERVEVKAPSNESSGPSITVNLKRYPAELISATMLAYCEESPAIKCETTEANPECSISCPQGSAIVKIQQNTANSCHHATFYPLYVTGVQTEANGDHIYRTPEYETELDFEMFFYGCD